MRSGQCAEFGYTLCASADSLAVSFGPVDRMWLCAVGQCAESLSIARNHTNFIKNIATSFIDIMRRKTVHVETELPKIYAIHA